MLVERLHQAGTVFAGVSFIELLGRDGAPIESLPKLFSVAGGGVARGAHAADQQLVAVVGKAHVKNTASVVVALDNAPAGERAGCPLGDLLALGQVPYANLTHQVAGGQKTVVRAERQ